MRLTGAVILLGVCASGCVSVTVNGYTGGLPPVSLTGSRVFVQVNDQGPNPLLADEIAQKLTQALKRKGYVPVETRTEAEYALVADYRFPQLFLFLRIFPLNRPSKGSPKPLWVGEVTCRKYSGYYCDRRTMDYLIAAGVEDMGENTPHGGKRHVYGGDDPLNDLQPRRPCPTPSGKTSPKGAEVLDEPRSQPCE